MPFLCLGTMERTASGSVGLNVLCIVCTLNVLHNPAFLRGLPCHRSRSGCPSYVCVCLGDSVLSVEVAWADAFGFLSFSETNHILIIVICLTLG